MANLDRFVLAQAAVYPAALDELRNGEKRSHWMWFIFPQIAGLGRSEIARSYAIANLPEAVSYLAHPLLGMRLGECTGAMLDWAGKRSAEAILGQTDAAKFASCMTLFEAAGGGDRFTASLNSFCDGKRDAMTLALLASGGQ